MLVYCFAQLSSGYHTSCINSHPMYRLSIGGDEKRTIPVRETGHACLLKHLLSTHDAKPGLTSGRYPLAFELLNFSEKKRVSFCLIPPENKFVNELFLRSRFLFSGPYESKKVSGRFPDEGNLGRAFRQSQSCSMVAAGSLWLFHWKRERKFCTIFDLVMQRIDRHSFFGGHTHDDAIRDALQQRTGPCGARYVCKGVPA
jgi:hypothetical protein